MFELCLTTSNNVLISSYFALDIIDDKPSSYNEIPYLSKSVYHELRSTLGPKPGLYIIFVLVDNGLTIY